VEVGMKLFRIYDQNTETAHYLELIGPPNLLKQYSKIEEADDLFSSMIQPEIIDRLLESAYGVHDVSFDAGKVLWGFTTDGIEMDRWNDLMEEWREIWENAGFYVGNYFKKKERDEGN
jgi:hypothetical protein